ncbi:Cleavage stimulation factor subunit 2 [Glugoides intestinalis]
MKQGCSVFVGNIDFDIDEQKVIEELSAVGKVVSFRMMYDKNTGKSKGYGFCEYESPLIAETAMKTLKISFNGRPVKINYAENDLPQKPKDTAAKPLQIDSIVSVLDTFDQNNLREVIDYLKKMAIDQPTQLKELLDRNPSLVVSILTVLVKLNLVNKEKIAELVGSSFDIMKQKEQIAERIVSINDQDLGEFPEEIKNKIIKLKYILAKK